MSEWRLPLSDLDYGSEEQAAAARVLESKWLSMGPEVAALEQEFAALVGVKHAIAVANGTAALHLSYLGLGIGPGDEIVQPALNFVAAGNVTVAVGARPAFADIVSLGEPTIDPEEVERRIGPATRAVLVMHYGGYSCRAAEVRELCERRGLALIEDACHAVGARYSDARRRPPHGRMCGALGDVAAFSFFGNKNLAVGEGGMVTTERDDVAARVRLLRSHGMTTLTWDRHRGHASTYDVELHGFNYRLDELRAALGRCQLRKLERNNARRGEIVETYRRALTALQGWTVPFLGHAGGTAYHLMTVVAPDRETRDKVVAALRRARIQSSLHYPCMTGFRAFERYRGDPTTRTMTFSERAISLPLFPGMTPGDVEAVVGVMQEALGERARGA